VARVIDKYDLAQMGSRLEAAWTGETGERTSLRDLADEFNETILTVALRDAGGAPMVLEVSGAYETLSSGTEADATRARRRLERKGINVDAVESDFVTHQAIHTYLKRDRDASLPTDDGDRRKRKIESIEKLQGRLTAVTESALSSLAATDDLNGNDFNVIVNVRAVCPECEVDRSVSEFLREGGCNCTD
jgi:hypothetical protein